MLAVQNLHAGISGKEILRGLSMDVQAGQVHAVMGPNGSGKSTLAHVLAGRGPYEVTGGQALFDGADLLGMAPEERAAAGLFLAFQHPVEIPGVANMYFLRTALNSLRHQRGQSEVSPGEFLRQLEDKVSQVGLDRTLLQRSVNEGFSGGEKKRNEVLQMALFEPRLAILDETDSGLDIDALRVVADGVEALRGPQRAFVIITHHQRLLEYVRPDRVHVLSGGRIVRSAGPELASELEANGYGEARTGRSTDELARAGASR